MINAKQKTWAPAMGTLLRDNDFDQDKTLQLTGEGIAGQLQQSIRDTYAPPLSPVTVMLRGMQLNNPSLKVTRRTVGEAAARVAAGLTNYGAPTKPLIWRGDMLNAVAYEVRK